MIDFCIIGSGISGSKIANLLSRKFTVQIFDKARGSGGRSSNKKFLNNLSFDHGVQYISPKDKNFKKEMKMLVRKKILKIWKGNHLDFAFKGNSGSTKLIGTKGNNDLVKYNLRGINKSFNSAIINIKKEKNYWQITLKDNSRLNFKNLIITCPYPQTIKLAKKYLNTKMKKLKVVMQPNITLMILLKNQKSPDISSIKFDDEIIAWAANENSKNRFKTNSNLWTIQSSLRWSKKNINMCNKNKKIIEELVSRFINLTGFKKKKVKYKKIHGWKYSFNYVSTNLESYWDKKLNLGICGDWFLGPQVEHAWRSAVSLNNKINKKT